MMPSLLHEMHTVRKTPTEWVIPILAFLMLHFHHELSLTSPTSNYFLFNDHALIGAIQSEQPEILSSTG